MNNISRTLKRWTQNGNMTLDDMARKVFERGWGEYRVLTYDELKEHILLMVEQGNCAASGSNFPADPIYNKQQLMNAVLYGYAE